jgi:signal transduction histidine kinase
LLNIAQFEIWLLYTMRELAELLEGDMRRGRHIAHFCETKDDILHVVVPYFKAGLENNEFCLCAVSEPLTEEEVRRVLRQEILSIDRYEANGQLELLSGREWYFKDGIFDPQRVLNGWTERLDRALARGCKSMRGAGSAFWLESKDFESFCEYEKQLNDLITRRPMTMVCIHSLHARSSTELLDSASVHHFSIATHDGQSAVIDSHDADRERPEEVSLRRADQNVEMILHSITDKFFSFSKDWKFAYLNSHAAEQMRILGKDPTSLIGKVLWEEFPDLPNEQTVRRAMRERVAITDELYYPPLGEWVENHMYPAVDGGLIVFQRYVTERKRAEEKLRRSEAYLADGQKMSHTGSWAWNVSTQELFWSLEHYRICGVDPQSFKPTIEATQQLIHADDRPRANQSFDSAVHEKRDFKRNLRMVRPDGTIRYVRSYGRPVLSESGDLIEYVGTIMDVTERKRAKEELQQAQAELARVARVATVGTLTASIAHEINQPLAAMVTDAGACVRWLEREVPNLDEARESLQRVIEGGHRAGDVIKGIISLAKKTPAKTERLNINEIIREVISLAARELTQNNVVLRMELQPAIPLVVGDRVQLQQVLLNLILNSIEAMSGVDSPVRELVIRSQESKPGEVMVTVRDSGAGLDPNDAERIFDSLFSTKSEGLGLGLSISRTIVGSLGGRLWATQNNDRGATFHFILPAIDETTRIKSGEAHGI